MRNLDQNPKRPQSIVVCGGDDLREHLAGRLKSGAWWLLVAANSPITADCFLEIEQRFYRGSANADFELAIFPWRLGPMVAVACARKRRLSAHKLLRVLAQFMKPASLDAARSGLAAGCDVLICEDAGPTKGQALMIAFAEFLQPGAALQVAMQN
jgi:hypothetical protein